jgi:hypothetical protein
MICFFDKASPCGRIDFHPMCLLWHGMQKHVVADGCVSEVLDQT